MKQTALEKDYADLEYLHNEIQREESMMDKWKQQQLLLSQAEFGFSAANDLLAILNQKQWFATEYNKYRSVVKSVVQV